MYNKFECIKCGECCHAGYEIYVQKVDIEQWMNLGKTQLLKHLIINPKSISINNNIIFEVKNGDFLLKKEYYNFNSDLRALTDFVLKNHYTRINPSLLDSHYKFNLNEFKQDLIFFPRSFNIMLEGIKLGIDYNIEYDSNGYCYFLELNNCSIHDFKPKSCKNFPFTKDKCLRNDLIIQ